MENIRCSHCDKIIRLPFNQCKLFHLICSNCLSHQNMTTGDIEDSTGCGSLIIFMPLFNKIYSNVVETCQYNCGYQDLSIKLADHENNCFKKDRLTRCQIFNCNWVNVLSKLVEHVNISHNNNLKNIENIIISSTNGINQIYLVDQIFETSGDKELYWLRFEQEDGVKNLSMQHIGPTDPKMDENRIIKRFTVSSLENKRLLLKCDVLLNWNYLHRIYKHIKSRGSDITVLKGETFAVKPDVVMDDSLMTFMGKELQCVICTMIMLSGIRLCLRGHSMCEECSKRITACPICRGAISEGRNYSLEHVAAKFNEKLQLRSS